MEVINIAEYYHRVPSSTCNRGDDMQIVTTLANAKAMRYVA